jgi:hypothetical protein
MLGVNLLVRLGRRVLAGPLAGAGLLPASYYRHLVLAALEAEDFPGALDYLKWAADPLLAQILVLRLRLLAARHARQRHVLLELMKGNSGAGLRPVQDQGWKPETREKYRHLLTAEDQALKLLADYEERALSLIAAAGKQRLNPEAGPRSGP